MTCVTLMVTWWSSNGFMSLRNTGSFAGVSNALAACWLLRRARDSIWTVAILGRVVRIKLDTDPPQSRLMETGSSADCLSVACWFHSNPAAGAPEPAECGSVYGDDRDGKRRSATVLNMWLVGMLQ